MNLNQAAALLEMNLNETISRFGGNEKLFLRFLTRLPQDATFQQLSQAMASEDWKGVENSAHTLKGVAANLGLEQLRWACDAMVTAVRQERLQELPSLYAKTEQAFHVACQTIQQLEL